MRKRTKARESALQILYQIDITKNDQKQCLQDFWQSREPEAEEAVRSFAESLVAGVVSHKDEIDEVISEAAENWELKRMATVDRNILRMAAFELLFAPDIPPKVAINEAIDIAKKFGDQDSGKFVNGVLDKIVKAKKPDAEKG